MIRPAEKSALATRRRYCCRGFTLVELVVIMIVIGILAVVVLPRFDLLKGFDEIGYRDKVKATLEYARKAAVAQRRYACVALAGNSLTLTRELAVPESTSGNCTGHPDLALPTSDRSCPGSPSNQICAPGGVTLTGTASLRFSPLGRPDAAASYAVTGDSAATITVEAETGYVH
jgi:MSHA pilin protein MshC